MAEEQNERWVRLGYHEFRPCPFCGSRHLGITEWWDDDGQFDAVCCYLCKAEAPVTAWNQRSPSDTPPGVKIFTEPEKPGPEETP